MSASEVAAWVGAVSGVGGLAIHGVRLKWDLGAEQRANRAALRAELRALAAGAKVELSEARAKAANGSHVGEVGETVQKCNGDGGINDLIERAIGVKKNSNVLIVPTTRKLFDTGTDAANAVFKIGSAWRDLSGAEAHPTVYTEHQRSVRAAEFLRLVGPATDACRKLVSTLDEMEP